MQISRRGALLGAGAAAVVVGVPGAVIGDCVVSTLELVGIEGHRAFDIVNKAKAVKE